MKQLSVLLFFSILGLSTLASAEKLIGPMPHERTDTPKKKNANVGRYLYVGVAPKFLSHELELIVSKMSLTLRAQAWMNQEKIDAYASELYKRWERIDQTLYEPNFEIHPLIKLDTLATRQTSIAWAKVAGQYSSHVLENRGVEIYNNKRNANSLVAANIESEYKSRISTAILRYFFNNNSLTPDSIKSDNVLRDSLLSAENSRLLFQQHFSGLYTASSEKQGYLGYITLVYPIAATVEGPFDQPREASRFLMSYGTIEARWWSDKWDDEFGGLPFILVNSAGVAFHGPITNFGPLDVWYLRRGYVSHGCHRMDASDVIELRNILPRSQKEIGKVRLTILNHFDVTDWNNDGKKEVVDVKYYNVPSAIAVPKNKTIEDVIKPYLVENQMTSFYKNHKYANKFYDANTDTIVKAPKYKIVKGVLVKDGIHDEALPFARFDYPKSRVIQYRELNTQLYPYDDNQGKFPPTYFLKN